MTEDEGYAAMFHFLNEYWKRVRSDDLGDILGRLDGVGTDKAVMATLGA